jgi:aldehyde:ferredoxin oxidoreductase
MELMNNYKENILIVDLDAKQCDTESLSEDMVAAGLGGAGITTALYEQYRDRDPLIIGTGFFTGTFMPGGCAGVVTAKSPITGKLCHVPFGGYAAVELKLTGFDFVVVLGKADSPVRLWLHDGLSDIDDAADIWGKDVWDSVDKIREAYGDDMIQLLLIGPAAEAQSKASQFSVNYWGSFDKSALGAVFGAKNLKAIALRGLDSLDVAEGFFGACVDLKNTICSGAISGKSGLKDIATDIGIDAAAIEKLSSMTHRNNAAYNCPYAAAAFVKYNEAPTAMDMKGHPAPGCLVTDIQGFAALHAAGLDAAQAMEQCFRQGLEPEAAAKAGKTEGVSEDAGKAAAFSTAVPASIFGSGQGDAWWQQRQALAAILGIDPMLMVMAPEIKEDKIVELVQMSAEWDDFSADELNRVIGDVIAKSA